MPKINPRIAGSLVVLVLVGGYLFLSHGNDLRAVSFKKPLALTSCSVRPKFVDKLGLPATAAFAASDRLHKGGMVILYKQDGVTKQYSDPQYDQAGKLGEIEIDQSGNAYTHPLPTINLADNPLEKRSIIWRVDAASGAMSPWVTLPMEKDYASDTRNPYGIMSIAHSCNEKAIYASTVYGSDEKTQRGVIYRIDEADKTIKEVYRGVDMFGIVYAESGSSKYLLGGSARESKIYSLDLKTGKLGIFASYAPTGLNLNSRVKKITGNKKTGDVIATITPFDYSLASYDEANFEQITFSKDKAGLYQQK